MVYAVEEAVRAVPAAGRQALVMEIVGPAGAGKTTIAHEFARSSKSVALTDPPSVRFPFDAPYYVSHCIRLSPFFFRLPWRKGRMLSRRQIAWLAILNGWHQILRREKATRRGVFLLDQGPVFLLAELHRLGPDFLRDSRIEGWWRRIYFHWATTVDTVVRVDAEDVALLERIRNRGKSHPMKERPEAEIVEFLERYRAAYEQVLSSLASHSPSPRLLRYDTTHERPDSIVDRLLLESGLIARESVYVNQGS